MLARIRRFVPVLAAALSVAGVVNALLAEIGDVGLTIIAPAYVTGGNPINGLVFAAHVPIVVRACVGPDQIAPPDDTLDNPNVFSFPTYEGMQGPVIISASDGEHYDSVSVAIY